MATLVLDFDSTLIGVESLEEILRPRLAARPDLVRAMEEITDLGMSGDISFAESLERRLELAKPALRDAEAFGERAAGLVTNGMDGVVAWAHRRGHDVRIVSGALRETVLPVARSLAIPEAHVHAVSARWGDGGAFLGLDPSGGFATSKLEGALKLCAAWPRPRVGVGDGMTDVALLAGGALDHFIAFTEHRRRDAVIRSGVPEARDASQLLKLLEGLL